MRSTIYRSKPLRAAVIGAVSVAFVVGGGAYPALAQMAAAAPPPPVEDTTWPVPASADASGDVGTNMVGGTDPTQDYPGGAFVSLKYDIENVVKDWHTCGATLSPHPSRRKIITAAHCVTDMPANVSADTRTKLAARFHLDPMTAATSVAQRQFHVRVGSPLLSSGGETARVRVTWVHPGWDWATTPGDVDDVAILEADTPLNTPALPIAPRSVQPDEKVWSLGWGLTTPDASGTVPEKVRELRSRVLPDYYCADAGTDPAQNRDVCVDNVKGKKGHCYGDSGGPAIVKIGRRYYQVGISSRMTMSVCGEGNTALTDPPAYAKELEDAMGRGPITTMAPPATRPTVQPLATVGS